MKLGTEEITKHIEEIETERKANSIYKRFEKTEEITIPKDKNREIEKRDVDYDKKKLIRYDLNILDEEGKEKIWAVSGKVLGTVNRNIDQTEKFRVTFLGGKSGYEVIPIIKK